MREDMPKKFLEPSSGKRGKFPRRSKKILPDEEGNTSIPARGMKKLHSVVDPDNDRYTGTDFSLMRRFLKSRRGRPWDEVYSEICQQADYRSHSGHHLREWISYLVDQNCRIVDGEVCDERGIKVAHWWNQFYVHPETKTLEYIEFRRYRRKENEQTVFEMDGVFYHKHDDGIWYRVKFAPVPKQDRASVYIRGVNDVFVEQKPYTESVWRFTQILHDKYGPGEEGTRYCCWKQQANSHEIEKLKKKYPDIS